MEQKIENPKLRQPIVTVCGHVDHGKTSILDCFRGTQIQEGEAGGITQKISFTKYPLEQIRKSCPLIEKNNINLEIPGFLFIDTPGHAAFTNLRKRGGALADLAILVVSIKEGIKPQTAEVLQILRANKTPFLIALNKVDSISGWKDLGGIKESVEGQASNVSEEFQESLLTFQGSLSEQGFESDLFYDVSDFTKKIAIVPCSAKTEQGISELLFVLCGLCQKFLKERLKVSDEAKGVILEVKKDRAMQYAEAIIYDGILREGDELVIASFSEPIIAKVRAIQEIGALQSKFVSVSEAVAATGVRIQLTSNDGILPGMPFQKVKTKIEIEKAKLLLKKEISGALQFDKQGIVIKAESLGSLEAMVTLLRQENILILKSGIGPINKSDITSAKANFDINPLDAVVIGFNVELEEGLIHQNVKVITNEVIYKLIEDLQIWRKEKQAEIEKDKLMELATICKIEVLHNYIFRNSNPAIFGVRILAGKAKNSLPLIDDKGEEVARIKSIQLDKINVEEAKEGQELALALPGTMFDRRMKDVKYLYSNISEKQFKKFKENKDLLSSSELKALQEIALIKKF